MTRIGSTVLVGGVTWLASCVCATPASAQAPTATLSGSYAAARDSGLDRTLPAGWVASGALTVAGPLAVAGEVSGGYGDSDALDGATYRSHGFMAGVRAARWNDGRVQPFGQLLLGVHCYCGSTLAPGAEAAKSFAWQIGAGVDAMVSRSAALRAQVDFRRTQGDNASFNQVRFAIGLAVYFSRRTPPAEN
jgi:hypothetical protein